MTASEQECVIRNSEKQIHEGYTMQSLNVHRRPQCIESCELCCTDFEDLKIKRKSEEKMKEKMEEKCGKKETRKK